MDSDTLPAEASGELQKLVEAAGVFGLPDAPGSNYEGADRFQYKLTIEAPDVRRSVVLHDLSPPLRGLVDWIYAHSDTRT